MRFLFPLLAGGLVAAAFAACGGATTADCPSNLGRGVACTSDGATCPYTLHVTACDGTSTNESRTCTCRSSGWDCPEVGQQVCDGSTCKNGDTKPAGDNCNTCTCMNGTWGCTLMACIDGGPPGPTDPGNVTCAGGPCSTANNYCCDTPTDGGALQKCVPNTTSSCGGLRRGCDEAADCTGGQVCCIPPNSSLQLAYNAECATTCKNDPFAYQLCKTSSECENGKTCVSQICRGYTIWSCGALPANRCN